MHRVPATTGTLCLVSVFFLWSSILNLNCNGCAAFSTCFPRAYTRMRKAENMLHYLHCLHLPTFFKKSLTFWKKALTFWKKAFTFLPTVTW